MNKLFAFIIVFSFLVSLAGFATAEVQYPISELGNCADKAACEAYCDDINNADTCLSIAEKYGMMTAAEVEEAKKILPFLKAGTTPGGCKKPAECETYCDNDANLMECIDFATKAGLISADEAALVKKTGGKGPGGCKREECKTYCDDESHLEECIDFAVQNGMIDASEAEMIKKTGGKGPGGCKGKEACDSYCKDKANFQTCIDFAVQHGLMTAEEAEMAKKTGGESPGGCKGKEECDAFCSNPDNMETCTTFAIEHGLVSMEQAEEMRKNMEFMKSSEGQCFTSCMNGAGVDSESCSEGGGPEACKTCADQCFQNKNEYCLSQEKWQQLNQDCTSKGGSYHLEEVRGSDGQGGECVVDEMCVEGSGDQWETQEEKDRKLAEMEAQWAEERARYESEQGPGSSTEGGSGGSGGGCTEPGPEGQCNPGPGAGSVESSGGTLGGEGTGGLAPGGEGGGTGEPGSGGEATPSGGGDSGSVTGGAILEVERVNSIQNFLGNLFS